MKLRIRHTAPVVIVAVALGAGSALLATSAGGSATDVKPPLEAVSDCKPVPARCGSAESDLTIVAALNTLDVPDWRRSPPGFLRVDDH